MREFSDAHVLMLTAQDTELDKVVGLRGRRRRLRHQAVQRRRARRPREGRAAPRANDGDRARQRAGRAPSAQFGALTVDAARPRGQARRRGRSSSPASSSTCSTRSPPSRASRSAAPSCSSASGARTGSATTTSSTSTSPTCAASSPMTRARPTSSAPCAASGIGWAPAGEPDGARGARARAAGGPRGGHPRLGPARRGPQRQRGDGPDDRRSRSSTLIGAPSDPSTLLAPGGGSIPPEQLPAARVERSKARVDQEFGIPHADGGHVWVAVRSAPRPDGTIISAYTQITEAEAKARASRPHRHARRRLPRPRLDVRRPRADRVRQPVVQRRARPAPGRGDRPPVARAHAPARRPRPARRARRRRPRRAAHRRSSRSACAPATAAGSGSRARRRCASAAAPRSRSRSSAATSPARAPPRTRAAGSACSSRRSSPARPYGILMLDQTGRIAVVNEQACSLLDLTRAPRGAHRRATPRSSAAPASACSPTPSADVARLREIAKAGETVRFVSVDCADGRRIGYDHVPLGEDGAPAACGRSATSPTSSSRTRSSASSWPR